jgi:hypothetical protein
VGQPQLREQFSLGPPGVGMGGQDHQRQRDQPSDGGGVVALGARAAVGRQAAGEVREEIPVVRLGVGVAVGVGFGHERDVVPQEPRRVVPAVDDQRPQQDPGAEEVERVVAGPQPVVVMDVRLAPQVLAALEDNRTDNLALLRAPPGASGAGQRHDRTGVLPVRRREITHDAVIPPQRSGVVVPVDRHGEGIADEQAPEGAADPPGHRNGFHPASWRPPRNPRRRFRVFVSWRRPARVCRPFL